MKGDGKMPNFRIVIEDTRTELREKTFTADTLDDAKAMAEGDETWAEEGGWTIYDRDSNCEIRDDQCGREEPNDPK
jgi:hypothetical protein